MSFNFKCMKIFILVFFLIEFYFHCTLARECDMNSISQFSRSVVSDSLRPHESQHARPPCPSTSPGVHSDSCPSSPWGHPAISSSVIPFSSCPQSLPASESFPMSQLFTWGGQSTGVSALTSFLSKLDLLNILSILDGLMHWTMFITVLCVLVYSYCLIHVLFYQVL